MLLCEKDCSTNEVLVVIKINSETITDHLETVLRHHYVRLWQSWHVTSILHHGKLLELLHSTSGTILLSILNRVVLLWHLKTEGWVTEDDANANHSTENHDNLRSLILEMHCRIWIWHFIVEVLILETNDGHAVPQNGRHREHNLT